MTETQRSVEDERPEPDKLNGIERYLLRLRTNAQGMDAQNLAAALDLLQKYRNEQSAAYLANLAEALDHETEMQQRITALEADRERLRGALADAHEVISYSHKHPPEQACGSEGTFCQQRLRALAGKP